jgi:hypothetical protein
MPTRDEQEEHLISWTDIIKKKFKHDLEIILDTRDYKRRVLIGIESFLRSHCSQAGLKKEECWIRRPGETTAILAIPKVMKERFLNWFDRHLENQFYAFDPNTDQLESIMKSPKPSKLIDTEMVSFKVFFD